MEIAQTDYGCFYGVFLFAGKTSLPEEIKKF